MRPPWIYRLVLNPLRTWLEDRQVPEAGYVDQMKALWRRKPEQKVVYMNLLVRRDARRKSMVA